MWTDDPVRDADRYFEEQDRQKALNDGPVCCECGNPIEEDFYYRIVDDVYCDACMDKHLVWIR